LRKGLALGIVMCIIGCMPVSKTAWHNGAAFHDFPTSSQVKILTKEPADIKKYVFMGYEIIWADAPNTPLTSLMGIAIEYGIMKGADIGLITGAGENFDMQSSATGVGATTTIGIAPGSSGQIGSSPTPGISKAWSRSGYRGLPWMHVMYFKCNP